MKSYNSIDSSNMYKSIYDFPDHLHEAKIIGESIILGNNYSKINNIVVAGMGGSAIGGDLLIPTDHGSEVRDTNSGD